MRHAYMNLSQLAMHTCLDESTILELVASNEFPRPKKRGQQHMWRWCDVEAAIDGTRDDRFRVYFIEAQGFIKIGFTSNLPQRIQAIRSGIPYGETILLHDIPGDFDLEVDMHRKFSHLRERGEWFRKEPELLDFIAAIKNGR